MFQKERSCGDLKRSYFIAEPHAGSLDYTYNLCMLPLTRLCSCVTNSQGICIFLFLEFQPDLNIVCDVFHYIKISKGKKCVS